MESAQRRLPALPPPPRGIRPLHVPAFPNDVHQPSVCPAPHPSPMPVGWRTPVSARLGRCSTRARRPVMGTEPPAQPAIVRARGLQLHPVVIADVGCHRAGASPGPIHRSAHLRARPEYAQPNAVRQIELPTAPDQRAAVAPNGGVAADQGPPRPWRISPARGRTEDSPKIIKLTSEIQLDVTSSAARIRFCLSR